MAENVLRSLVAEHTSTLQLNQYENLRRPYLGI